MDQNELIGLVKTMIGDSDCCMELKDAGAKYLAAVGTPDETDAYAVLIQEIREDVCTVDAVIEFFRSDDAKKMFGADVARSIVDRFSVMKSAGEKWCNCVPCTTGLKILRLIGDPVD